MRQIVPEIARFELYHDAFGEVEAPLRCPGKGSGPINATVPPGPFLVIDLDDDLAHSADHRRLLSRENRSGRQAASC